MHSLVISLLFNQIINHSCLTLNFHAHVKCFLCRRHLWSSARAIFLSRVHFWTCFILSRSQVKWNNKFDFQLKFEICLSFRLKHIWNNCVYRCALKKLHSKFVINLTPHLRLSFSCCFVFVTAFFIWLYICMYSTHICIYVFMFCM